MERRADRPGGLTGPIMLISPGDQAALQAQIEALGWRVVSARSMDGLETRLQSSQVAALMIDVRDGAVEALQRFDHLGRPVVAICNRADDMIAEKLLDSGISQIILAPFAELDIKVALRLATHTKTSVIPTRFAGAARRDALTGLSDANGAREWMKTRLARDDAAPVSALLINISRYDTINSAFGTEAGDSILQIVAQRIAPVVGEFGHDCIVARSSGAEFLVAIASEVAPTRLVLLAEAIAKSVERPISVSGDVIRLGCRIGIAPPNQAEHQPALILKRAGQALGEAKLLELGRIHVVSDSVTAASATSALNADLRLALMRGEIEVLFQPQVSVVDGAITGVEALARWQHPAHGELGAATLFAVAEQSDYMLELSAHVQRVAATEAAQWPEALRDLRLSINVTAEDLAKPDFVTEFLAMVDASAFARDRLTVEITETSLMEDLAKASDILAELRAAGCRVAIDDFGTGYSSLAYLKALPLDYLKIDRSLSVDIAGSARDTIVVRGVIDMARSLGLSVIAEGVETDEQLELLAQEGCNFYQGFLCAAPMSTADLVKLVEHAH